MAVDIEVVWKCYEEKKVVGIGKVLDMEVPGKVTVAVLFSLEMI